MVNPQESREEFIQRIKAEIEIGLESAAIEETVDGNEFIERLLSEGRNSESQDSNDEEGDRS